VKGSDLQLLKEDLVLVQGDKSVKGSDLQLLKEVEDLKSQVEAHRNSEF
jgi:hypothetical protein